MFERFTEAARRALFFARYEASQLGSLTIGSEHLLLGLTREPTRVVASLLALSRRTPNALREQVASRDSFREKVSTSVELPFTKNAKQVLVFAAEEADRLLHVHIGPEHMLLALLRVEGSAGHKALTSNGMGLEASRDELVRLVTRAPDVNVRRRIERIKTLVGQLSELASDPRATTALAHAIQVELSSLVNSLDPGESE